MYENTYSLRIQHPDILSLDIYPPPQIPQLINRKSAKQLCCLPEGPVVWIQNYSHEVTLNGQFIWGGGVKNILGQEIKDL